MRIILCAAVLLTASLPAFARKPIDIDTLRGATYTEVQGHVNHNQRLAFNLKGSVLVNELPLTNLLKASEKLEKGALIREEFGIDDPALQISSELASMLGDLLDLPAVPGSVPAIDEDRGTFARAVKMVDPAELSDQYGPRKLVVNVGTTRWGVNKRSKDRYFLFYLAAIEIADTSTDAVVWKSACFYPLRRKSRLPHLSTVLDENAANLKEEISRAVDYCVAEFADTAIGNSP